MLRTTSLLAGVALFGAIAALAIPEPNAQQARIIPDPDITPGVIANDGHSEREVCAIVAGLSYSKRHRATPSELKRAIRKRDACDPHNSEVDHRIPLALGGADKAQNLWCQPGGGVWDYHRKDHLEVWAWESVCKHHTLTLEAAQAIFLAPDWRIEYCARPQVSHGDPACADIYPKQSK